MLFRSVPVLDEQAMPVNTENDDIVALLHKTLHAHRVVQLIEAPGFLSDHTDPESLLNSLTEDELKAWEARAEGRIKRKLRALVKLFEGSPAVVHIGDGRVPNPIDRLFQGEGTVIQ